MSDGLGNLLRISQKQLEQRSDPERQAYYKQLDTSYHAVVDEFFDLGDQHVMRFQKLTTRHQRWRRNMIWATGVVAILNLLIAFNWPENSTLLGLPIKDALSLGTAIYASLIVLFGNLESFRNYPEKALAHREAREQFVDAARKYEMLWHVHVRPFADRPEGLLNAAALYERIVVKDQEVRASVREMTKKTQQSAPAQGDGDS